MKDSTKKWLTITGGLVICAILVFVIAQQFTKEKATDALPPTSSSQQGEEVGDPDGSNPTTDPDASSDISEDDLTINPQTSPNDTGTNAGNGAISSGTLKTRAFCSPTRRSIFPMSNSAASLPLIRCGICLEISSLKRIFILAPCLKGADIFCLPTEKERGRRRERCSEKNFLTARRTCRLSQTFCGATGWKS